MLILSPSSLYVEPILKFSKVRRLTTSNVLLSDQIKSTKKSRSELAPSHLVLFFFAIRSCSTQFADMHREHFDYATDV